MGAGFYPSERSGIWQEYTPDRSPVRHKTQTIPYTLNKSHSEPLIKLMCMFSVVEFLPEELNTERAGAEPRTFLQNGSIIASRELIYADVF